MVGQLGADVAQPLFQCRGLLAGLARVALAAGDSFGELGDLVVQRVGGRHRGGQLVEALVDAVDVDAAILQLADAGVQRGQLIGQLVLRGELLFQRGRRLARLLRSLFGARQAFGQLAQPLIEAAVVGQRRGDLAERPSPRRAPST